MVVTDALTIVGNGPNTTQIWGGPGPSSGVDSVFSFNAGGFLPGFAVSISGLTIQYGLNASALGYPDGGALDFSGCAYDGSGSLAIANCNILQNGTTNGFGGGLGLFYGGTVTIANTTISGNQARTPGTGGYYSGYGGGIFVGLAGPNSANVTITNSSVSGNSASTPGQAALSQDGGGIYSMPGVVDDYPLPYAYYYNSIAIHGSSISNNQASGQGAGLNGHFLIDQNSVISGNAAVGYGGGVFGWFSINHSSLTNNSSPLGGSAASQLDPGGIEGDPSQPLSSIHSSRIAGNGPAGVLAVDACVGVDVTNSWWGSNTSPASQVNPAVVTFAPWLVMTLAAPSSVPAGGAAILTASINTGSGGSTGFAVADGTPVAFSGTLGTLSPANATTLAGSASSTYTAGSRAGAASGSATIDGQTLTASFNVSLPPAPTLTSVSPASGVQGTSVPVTLAGTNFVAGAAVAVSNTGVIVSNVAVVSTTQITATLIISATAATGAANVTVTTSGGTSGPAVFTVNPPAPTLTPPNALIVSDTSPGYQAVIASYLAAALQSAHYNVVTVTSVPGTIPVWNGTTGYKQVWDIRADLTVSLLGAEAASYSNYLIAGGSLFLAGENCTFAMSRDYDIAAFVSGVGGGAITPTDAGNSESVLPPFTTTPDAVTSITFLSAGGSSSPGTGSFIDQDTSPADGVGAGIVWPPGSLAGARAGTLIVVFDEDFIVNTGDPGSVAYLANLIGYLNSPAQ
jgi:hypothetical protein